MDFDKDLISENGKRRYSPYFKPDWLLDTLKSILSTGDILVKIHN